MRRRIINEESKRPRLYVNVRPKDYRQPKTVIRSRSEKPAPLTSSYSNGNNGNIGDEINNSFHIFHS